VNSRLFAGVVMIVIAALIGARHAAAQVPSARSVAKDAFIYGFSVVAGYETLYKQPVDRSAPSGIISQAVAGGAGGAILTAIIGAIKNKSA
jgi:hypothetical protein